MLFVVYILNPFRVVYSSLYFSLFQDAVKVQSNLILSTSFTHAQTHTCRTLHCSFIPHWFVYTWLESNLQKLLYAFIPRFPYDIAFVLLHPHPCHHSCHWPVFLLLVTAVCPPFCHSWFWCDVTLIRILKCVFSWVSCRNARWKISFDPQFWIFFFFFTIVIVGTVVRVHGRVLLQHIRRRRTTHAAARSFFRNIWKCLIGLWNRQTCPFAHYWIPLFVPKCLPIYLLPIVLRRQQPKYVGLVLHKTYAVNFVEYGGPLLVQLHRLSFGTVDQGFAIRKYLPCDYKYG